MASPALLGNLVGLHLVAEAREGATWVPLRTPETRAEKGQDDSRSVSTRRLWLEFAGLAAATGAAGYFIGTAGSAIADITRLSESVVGALLTGVSTSLPELVTALAAVRQGDLQLAVGDIIGGNAFDVLFLAGADAAYRDGSIYEAIGERQVLAIAITILMTATLLLGLLRREKHGFANIGFESVGILGLYALFVSLALTG